MTNKYPEGSLGYLLLKHNNDYGFDASVDDGEIAGIPNLSVAIPYFEAKSAINITLKHVISSLEEIAKQLSGLKYEIIVVDDGSRDYPAESIIDSRYLSKIKLIKHSKNLSRYQARNSAIENAQHEFLLFSDADIVVDPQIVLSHLLLYKKTRSENKNVITTSIFNFISLDQYTEDSVRLLVKQTNDFRVHCLYQATWIGCNSDKQFTDQTFDILKRTSGFRKWPKEGYLGPWVISNMVLGGLFGMSSDLAKQVGGCDPLFVEYGFEETSLATKLIALHNALVIPVSSHYALHVGDPNGGLTQQEKDRFFQKAHALYFDKYLFYDGKKAITKPI